MQDIVATAMSLTSFARTVDALLASRYNTNLHTFITVNRDKGFSNHEIAQALADLTNGTVNVTRTTIANWAEDALEKVAS